MYCKNVQHATELYPLFEKVVESLIVSSRSLDKAKQFQSKSGWNEYAKEFHVETRRAFKPWAESGKPKHGPRFDYKEQANAHFKNALRFIKRHKNIFKCESLARKLQHKGSTEFLNEIKSQ